MHNISSQLITSLACELVGKIVENGDKGGENA